jgi:hypothetical protein
VSLAKAIVTALADRLGRGDVSAWQKARDVAEFQAYLRGVGQQSSTREIGRLLGISQSRITEFLSIASELTPQFLEKLSISAAQLDEVDHRALFRVSKLPPYLRHKPLKDALRPVGQLATQTHEDRRAYAYKRLATEGRFVLEIEEPIVQLTPKEARTHLDDMLPAVAHLVERIKGSNRSHYIGLAGNGGIVIYLAP